MILRMEWPDWGETVDCQFVERDQVFAIGFNGIPFSGKQVSDVVMNRNLVQNLAFQIIPAYDHGVDVEGGVNHPLHRIILGMQWP